MITKVLIAKGLAMILLSIPFFLLLLPQTLLHQIPIKGALAIELGSINEITDNITKNLNTEIEKIVSNALNNTNSIINATSASISNNSNISSSQIIVSNNQNVSANATGGALIINQIESKNGQCSSNIVGGQGNDTVSSTGVCDDQLTGGLGADKFVCGQGRDTIRDFDSEEGDIIVDPENCEIIYTK
jgi:hypothetical protein